MYWSAYAGQRDDDDNDNDDDDTDDDDNDSDTDSHQFGCPPRRRGDLKLRNRARNVLKVYTCRHVGKQSSTNRAVAAATFGGYFC